MPDSAIFSPCGLFRYRLDRELTPTGLVFGYCGVNASTAGRAGVEDQTTMKWRGFTIRNGGRGYIAFNPFARIATDVDDLARCDDPVGPDNDRHIASAIAEADILVPCWGSRLKLPPRLRRHLEIMLDRILAADKPVMAFGWTKSGDPKHPLMLGYETSLILIKP